MAIGMITFATRNGRFDFFLTKYKQILAWCYLANLGQILRAISFSGFVGNVYFSLWFFSVVLVCPLKKTHDTTSKLPIISQEQSIQYKRQLFIKGEKDTVDLNISYN